MRTFSQRLCSWGRFLAAAAAIAACGGTGDTPSGDGGISFDGASAGDPDATPGISADGSTSASPDAAGGGTGDDPGEAGTFTVYEEDVSVPGGGSSIGATLFAPSTDGGGTIAAGPFPLVVISPGFQMVRAQYASYGRHLASWGFVVVAQDFPGGFFNDHEDLAAQVTSILDWSQSAGSGIASHVDPSRIATSGHSLGGKISILAAIRDPRIGAVVGWDPVDSNAPSVTPELMGDLDADLAVLGETTNGSGGFMPCAPAADNFQQYYAAAASPALEVDVLGADHMDWVDDPSCGLCGLCSPDGTASDAEVKRLTRRTTTAWLRRRLLGDLTMDGYLTGAVMQADVTAGRVAVQSR
jgi:hypothetical protein